MEQTTIWSKKTIFCDHITVWDHLGENHTEKNHMIGNNLGVCLNNPRVKKSQFLGTKWLCHVEMLHKGTIRNTVTFWN